MKGQGQPAAVAAEPVGHEGARVAIRERKAAMVSNLMVVLCGDQPPSRVVNAGTLYS
jgi:hypothetical protein